jgi:uncharacterized membrane protein
MDYPRVLMMESRSKGVNVTLYCNPVCDRPFPFNQIRLRFGIWLALALEFQLGADVVATTIAPTLEQLGKLALIAAVLNYWLKQG